MSVARTDFATLVCDVPAEPVYDMCRPAGGLMVPHINMQTCLTARNLCCIAHNGVCSPSHLPPDRLVWYLRVSQLVQQVFSRNGVTMNEREAIQRELTRERRTMQRQELLKRLRKLDVENRRNPVVEETAAAVKSTPVGLPSPIAGKSTNGLKRNGRPDAGSMTSRV